MPPSAATSTPPTPNAFALLPVLAFSWCTSTHEGRDTWSVTGPDCGRVFWRAGAQDWHIEWKDPGAQVRRMQVDASLRAQKVADTIARWHINRAVALVRKEPPTLQERLSIDLLEGLAPGVLPRHASALLRRPVCASYRLSDLLVRFFTP